MKQVWEHAVCLGQQGEEETRQVSGLIVLIKGRRNKKVDTGDMASNELKLQRRLRIHIRTVNPWDRLPRQDGESPFLEVSKKRLGRCLSGPCRCG